MHFFYTYEFHMEVYPYEPKNQIKMRMILVIILRALTWASKLAYQSDEVLQQWYLV